MQTGKMPLHRQVVPRRWPMLPTMLVFEGGLAVVALMLGWIFGVSPVATWTWSLSAIGWGVLASVPLLVFFVCFERWPIGPLQEIRDFLSEHFLPLLLPMSTLDLFLISLSAGMGEEILFRGFVQSWAGDWFGTTWGLLLASVLFGLAHMVTPTYAVVATVIGLLLGGLWLWTGNLLAPVVTHTVYDFVALVYMVTLTRQELRTREVQ
ncbi:MAG: CPBP family intramembrane glutamic endopeptidase [Planctomycetota bacterium]